MDDKKQEKKKDEGMKDKEEWEEGEKGGQAGDVDWDETDLDEEEASSGRMA